MFVFRKAYTLSSDNLKILCHCLSILSDFPPHFFMYDKVMVNQIAMKISCQTQNYKINEALGKYNLYISKVCWTFFFWAMITNIVFYL